MYNHIAKAFTLRGLVFNSASFGSILCLAEFTQESIEKYRGMKTVVVPDVQSLKRHAFMGSCVIAPMLYSYYCWLDNRFPGKRLRTIAIKVANDVFIANIAYYGTFYYGMSYLEHQNHQRAKADLKKAFGITYILGMVYWVWKIRYQFQKSTKRHYRFPWWPSISNTSVLTLVSSSLQWHHILRPTVCAWCAVAKALHRLHKRLKA